MASPTKYTDSERQRIVAWFALGDPLPLVQQRIKDELGKDEQNLTTLWNNYHPDSKQASAKWRRYGRFVKHLAIKHLLEIPIARKARRLQVLNEVVNEALMWRTKSVGEWGEVQERRVGLIIGAVREARLEVEGEKALVDQSEHHHLTLVDVIRDAQRIAAARKRETAEGSANDQAVPGSGSGAAPSNGVPETRDEPPPQQGGIEDE